jgi:hypothetical protein
MNKPVLECNEEIIRSVDYYTLDQYIKKVTGHDYDCVGSEEWGNDSQHRFNVRTITAKYELKEWKKFKKSGTKEGFMLRIILYGLCTDGFIPAGMYLITVCW